MYITFLEIYIKGVFDEVLGMDDRECVKNFFDKSILFPSQIGNIATIDNIFSTYLSFRLTNF